MNPRAAFNRIYDHVAIPIEIDGIFRVAVDGVIPSKGGVMKRSFTQAVMLVGIMSGAVVNGGVACAQTGPRRVEVTAKRYAFVPSDVTLKKGQPVILVLKSMDVAHGLRFRELGLDVK